MPGDAVCVGAVSGHFACAILIVRVSAPFEYSDDRFRLIDAATIYRVRRWTIPPRFSWRAFARTFPWIIIMPCSIYSVPSFQDEKSVSWKLFDKMRVSDRYYHGPLFLWSMMWLWSMTSDTFLSLYRTVVRNACEPNATLFCLQSGIKWKAREALSNDISPLSCDCFSSAEDRFCWKTAVVRCYSSWIIECYCIDVSIKMNSHRTWEMSSPIELRN